MRPQLTIERFRENSQGPVVGRAGEIDKPFADLIAAAEKTVREEAMAKLTPAERELASLKEAQLNVMRRQASEAEHAARLADPRVVAAMAEVDRLKAEAAFSPDWTMAQVAALERAELQLTTPGACLETALELTATAKAISTAKSKAISDAIAAKQAELAAELGELGLVETTPTVEQPQPEVPATPAPGDSDGQHAYSFTLSVLNQYKANKSRIAELEAQLAQETAEHSRGKAWMKIAPE